MGKGEQGHRVCILQAELEDSESDSLVGERGSHKGYKGTQMKMLRRV